MLRPAVILLFAALLPLNALAHRPSMTAAHATALGRQYAHPPASENTIKAHTTRHTPKFPWWFLRRHIAAAH